MLSKFNFKKLVINQGSYGYMKEQLIIEKKLINFIKGINSISPKFNVADKVFIFEILNYLKENINYLDLVKLNNYLDLALNLIYEKDRIFIKKDKSYIYLTKNIKKYIYTIKRIIYTKINLDEIIDSKNVKR